eukprot:scaffold1876_cov132-Isochrysis_galbana.AAC.2
MGDPAMYPEIRAARNIYALQRLPSDFTADVFPRNDNNVKFTSPSMCSTSVDVSILVGGCRIRGFLHLLSLNRCG